MLTIRHAHDRGHANHGWLDSHHSFSFAGYHDDAHMHFGPLRVINEDQIHAETGFGTHSHRDMEIISYVLDGELAHKDSMNNSVVIRPGEVQRMSAGTGVMHSEHNHADRTTHFLQIWIIPDTMNLKPGYEQKFFPEEEKRGKLRLVASRSGELGSVIVHQDIRMYAGLFEGNERASLEVAPGRLIYVHVVRGSLSVNDRVLGAGDAAKLVEETNLILSNGSNAEVLIFDLPSTF